MVAGGDRFQQLWVCGCPVSEGAKHLRELASPGKNVQSPLLKVVDIGGKGEEEIGGSSQS